MGIGQTSLKEFVAKKRLLRIVRDIPGTLPEYGFLLAFSSKFLLVHLLVEFHLDGYKVILRKDVKELQDRPEDRFFARILKSEGTLDQVASVDEIDLKDWPSLLRSLKNIGGDVILEGEHPDVDEFKIGKVLRVNRSMLSFRHYDAMGRWEKLKTAIPYDQITAVSWDNEYVNTFSKYVIECPMANNKRMTNH